MSNENNSPMPEIPTWISTLVKFGIITIAIGTVGPVVTVASPILGGLLGGATTYSISGFAAAITATGLGALNNLGKGLCPTSQESTLSEATAAIARIEALSFERTISKNISGVDVMTPPQQPATQQNATQQPATQQNATQQNATQQLAPTVVTTSVGPYLGFTQDALVALPRSERNSQEWQDAMQEVLA